MWLMRRDQRVSSPSSGLSPDRDLNSTLARVVEKLEGWWPLSPEPNPLFCGVANEAGGAA